jgi:glyoxylase-like metal-dependent hydrolase (beta-lactamase superfamily II)
MSEVGLVTSPGKRHQDIVVTSDWKRALPRKIYAELELVDSNEKWFEVYRIRSDVYAFYEPGQFEEVISYLLLGGERAALIDTGMGIGNIRRLAEEFTAMPITVVNTHSHYDHVAQNYLFNSVALCEASCSRRVSENGYGVHKMKPFLAREMLSRELPEGFDVGHYHVPPFKVTRWLKDREEIELGNRKLDVVHTPGHSPDSICLLDRNSRLLWTGDTFYPGAIYVHMPDSDLGEFIKSYQTLVALSKYYDILLPSHNEPRVDKKMLGEVLRAAQEIRDGNGEYIEGTFENGKVRRYEYSGFSIITRIDVGN